MANADPVGADAHIAPPTRASAAPVVNASRRRGGYQPPATGYVLYAAPAVALAGPGRPYRLPLRRVRVQGLPLVPKGRWRAAPEGIRAGDDRPLPAIRQRSVAVSLQPLSLAARASSGLPLSLPGPRCGPPRQAAAGPLRSLLPPLAALPCGPLTQGSLSAQAAGLGAFDGGADDAGAGYGRAKPAPTGFGAFDAGAVEIAGTRTRDARPYGARSHTTPAKIATWFRAAMKPAPTALPSRRGTFRSTQKAGWEVPSRP